MNSLDGLAYLGETLLEMTLATSAAMVLVMLLRRPVRTHFGASVAYALWLLVPASLLAVLLPAREVVLDAAPMVFLEDGAWTASSNFPAAVGAIPAIEPVHWELLLWILGVVIVASWFVWRQWRFQRGLGKLRVSDDDARLLHAEAVSGLPAVIGCWKPRIVLPADFELRYSVDQRRLMLAHERTHIRSGDLQFNALLLLLRCLFWFNPLVHFIARAFRHDQELACDQRVIAKHPGGRRSYGEAMIHTQLVAQALPLACQWGYSHPLKERIAMLKQPAPTTLRLTLGTSLVGLLTLGIAVTAWATQPATVRAVVPTVEAGQIRADLQLTVGGIAFETVSVINKSAEAFSVKLVANSSSWNIDGVATERGDGKIDFSARISDQNGVVASPKLVVLDGKPSGISIADSENADAAALELGVTLTSSHFIPPPPVVTKADVAAGKKVPPPPPKAGVSSLDRMPSYRERVEPVYPESAHSDRREGTTVLGVMVKADGTVARTDVSKSSGHADLDLAAQQAVAKWTFEPAMTDGKPVKAWVGVPIRFELGQGFYPGVNNLLEPVDVKPGSSVPVAERLPEYPKTEAGKNGGHVMLQVTVQPDGRAKDLKVIESEPPGVFDATAIAAVSTWQFDKPESGKATQVLVPVKFAPEGQ